MRKITDKITRAFVLGQRLTLGNSSTDGQTLFLHGNAIVRKTPRGYEVNWCGWVTPTTANRINGAMQAAGLDRRVCSIKRRPHLRYLETGRTLPVPSNGWVNLSLPV